MAERPICSHNMHIHKTIIANVKSHAYLPTVHLIWLYDCSPRLPCCIFLHLHNQMRKTAMSKGAVLVLAGPEYEDMELWYPKYRLESAGYAAPIAGIGEDHYRGKHGYPVRV